MAGEYSRELSAKVFAGQGRLIEKGYRQGGPAGFGLRRTLIDESGNVKGTLTRGQHKSIQTDRVVLTPGPDEETAVVRDVYRAFVIEGLSEIDIARRLNKRGILTDLERAWTRGTVHQLLINEKYVGDNVWNRKSFKLKRKRVSNKPDMWIRAPGVFEAIVDRDLFDAAQSLIAGRSFRLSDEEMIEALKTLYSKQGLLSGIIIDDCDGMPSSSAYRSRFGSLLDAYRLVGFTPGRDYRYIEINRHLRDMHPDIFASILEGLRATGSQAVVDSDNDRIIVNDEFSLSVVIARCLQTDAGLLRWRPRFETSLMPDITIVIRMNELNSAPLDYFLFPRIEIASQRLKLAEENGFSLDAYRFEQPDYLYELSSPVSVMEAA